MNNSMENNMRDEYDLSHLRPNPYAEKYAEGVNLVAIEPDLFKIFPDSESVNNALRALLSALPQDMFPRLRQENQPAETT
ncbi:MAG: hypothetical protein KJ638_10000 [Chloroflexi bacterium]|nr:hypothetical protein [Chloroflexota bacterium]